MGSSKTLVLRMTQMVCHAGWEMRLLEKGLVLCLIWIGHRRSWHG